MAGSGDLKPDNVLLKSSSDGKWVAKVGGPGTINLEGGKLYVHKPYLNICSILSIR